MSRKPFVIGLTGNIASGKTVIRNYLANFGAYAIDADLTAKDTYLPGSPAWQAILDHFGDDLRMADDQINRSKLGLIVLADSAELKVLEDIVHPIVDQVILNQIEQCNRPILVIEAIKILESNILNYCDQVWTAAADKDVRFRRLVESRGHSESLAWEKVNWQAPQEDKIARSDAVIWTNGSFAETYQQTSQILSDLELPTVRQVSRNAHSLRTMDVTEFPLACDLISQRTGREWTCDHIYQLLGGKLAPVLHCDDRLIQVQRLSNRQQLVLLTSQAPVKTETVTTPEAMALLQAWLGNAYSLLAVTHDVLPAKEAWQASFLPSEDLPEAVPYPVYASFLRENGLMPGEVWIKPLRGDE